MNIPESTIKWFSFLEAIREMELGNVVQTGNGDLFRITGGLIQTKRCKDIIEGTDKWKGIKEMSSLTSMKFSIAEPIAIIVRKSTFSKVGIKQITFKQIPLTEIWGCSGKLHRLFQINRWFFIRLLLGLRKNRTMLFRSITNTQHTATVLDAIDAIARTFHVQAEVKFIDDSFAVLNPDKWLLRMEFINTSQPNVMDTENPVHILLYTFNKK